MTGFSLLSLLRFVENGGAGSAAERPPLQYPLAPVPRVVVLGADMRRERGVVCLPEWSARLAELSRAQALAGSFPQFCAVAAMQRHGALDLPHLHFPLVVFSTPQAGPLTEPQHEELWTWFRLPVFEQIRADGGRLLAYECEAREGFHLAHAGARLPHAEVLEGPCPCGMDGPRARLAPSAPQLAHAYAVTR